MRAFSRLPASCVDRDAQFVEIQPGSLLPTKGDWIEIYLECVCVCALCGLIVPEVAILVRNTETDETMYDSVLPDRRDKTRRWWHGPQHVWEVHYGPLNYNPIVSGIAGLSNLC